MFSSGSAHRSTREGSPPIRREWFATEPDQSSGDDGFAATKRRRPASPFQASLRRSRARDPGRDDSDSGVPGRACPVEWHGMRSSLLFPAGDGGRSLDGSVSCAACARLGPTAAVTGFQSAKFEIANSCPAAVASKYLTSIDNMLHLFLSSERKHDFLCRFCGE